MPGLRAAWQCPGAVCVYTCGDPLECIYGPPEYDHFLVLVCPLAVYIYIYIYTYLDSCGILLELRQDICMERHTRSPIRLRLHVINDKTGVWIYNRLVDAPLLGY